MTTPILRAMSQVRIGASESTGPAVDAKAQKLHQKQAKLKQQQLFVLRESNSANAIVENMNTTSSTAMTTTVTTGAAGNDEQTAAIMAKNEFNLPMLNTSQELFWYAASTLLFSICLCVCVCVCLRVCE